MRIGEEVNGQIIQIGINKDKSDTTIWQWNFIVKKQRRMIMNRNDVLTDPKKLVKVELKNAGFNIDKIKIPDRVYLLADDIFDEMVSRDAGEYRYPLGGKLYVFNRNSIQERTSLDNRRKLQRNMGTSHGLSGQRSTLC